jgi:hypothetical protein
MILLTAGLLVLAGIALVNTLRQRSEQLPVPPITRGVLDEGGAREVFPDVIVAPGLNAVCTDSRHYGAITDGRFRFIPMRLTSDDLERIHGPNERISLENYLEIIRLFIQQSRNSAS